jgi:type VII secretion protein EccB
MQSALLVADPDRPEPPLRRAGVSTFAGLMVAVLVLAGFGIYGVLKKGGKQGWAEEKTIIVEKETGTRYIFDPTDGALHPVLNYTSARLILDSAEVHVEHFSHASLAAAPHGTTRGIPGLPDGLPGSEDLVDGPWTVCSGSTAGPTSLSLSVGAARPPDEAVPADRAVVVRVPDGTHYLLWRNTRLRMPDAKSAMIAFGYTDPLPVSPTWINTVPSGPDLEVPAVAGSGGPAAYQVDGRQVIIGQLFDSDLGSGDGHRYYLATQSGLVAVPETVKKLNDVSDPINQAGAIRVSPAAINEAPLSDAELVGAGFPGEVRDIRELHVDKQAQGAMALCSGYRSTTENTTSTTVSVASAASVPTGGAEGRTVDGVPVRVFIPSGKAAVVRNLPHAGQPGEAAYLVTDQGAKYPVPPAQGSAAHVLEILGYGAVQPVPVPDSILQLLPSGPALEQSAANVDVPVRGPEGAPT